MKKDFGDVEKDNCSEDQLVYQKNGKQEQMNAVIERSIDSNFVGQSKEQ